MRDQVAAILVATIHVVMCLAPAALADVTTEDFDHAGSDWADTIFPDLHPSGDGTFAREPLAPGLAAPDTSPPVPVNVGGDKEGRFYEDSFAPAGSYAFTADIPENVVRDATIEGYVAFGTPDGQGTPGFAFLLRTSNDDPVDAYAALLARGMLSLVRIRDDLVGGGADTFAESQTFAVNPGQENFRVSLSVVGAELSASLWRVRQISGAIVETPVDLFAEPGVQNTLEATDGELTEGRAGVRMFARGDDSVFIDDITLTPRGCAADIDGSGAVDIGDVIAVLSAWGNAGGSEDLDHDGTVNFGDLLVVLGAWGACQ